MVRTPALTPLLLARILLLFSITSIVLRGPLDESVFAKSKHSALERPQLVTERGQLSWISYCSFVKGDQDVITAGGGDQTAVLWHTATGRELRRLRGHTAQVLTVVPHPSLSQVLTGSVDTTARLWDLSTGKEVRVFKGHRDAVIAAAFTRTGDRFFTIGLDGSLRLWRVTKTSPLRTVTSGFANISSAAFSDDATKLVVKFKDKRVALFDPASGHLIRMLRATSSTPDPDIVTNPIVISHNGSLAAILDSRMDTEIYDLATGVRLWIIPFDYEDEINAASFTRNGSQLMVLKSASKYDPRRDSEVPKHSAPKHESERWYEAHVKVSAYHLDARSGRQLSSFPLNFWQPTSIAFNQDSTISAISSNDATARLLSIPSGYEIQRFEGHDNTIGAIAVSPDWGLIAAAGEGPMAIVWDLKASQMAPGFGPHRGKPLELMFNSAGTELTTKDVDDYHYWDVRSRREKRRVGRNTYAGILAITSDAQRAIGYTLPPFQRWFSIVVFNPTDGKKILEFPLPTFKNFFGPAIFGPDGISVYGIHDERVSKVDTNVGVERWLSPEQTDSIPSLTLSSDGSHLLTAGWDHTAKVWNTSTGVLEKTLVGHQSNVEAVSFNQDGNVAVSGSEDETARVWNVSGQSRVVKSERILKGHIGSVNAVGMSPSSDVVVTGGQDGAVRLWRRSDGSEICTLIGTDPDRWAVVTPEGRFDTANLDEVKGLHWMFPDDPFHPLNPEIYLRDYYEPRLLSRLLFSTNLNEFRPIRPLQSLNRAVPVKPIIRISRENNSDTVTAEIDVAGDSYALEKQRRSDYADRGIRGRPARNRQWKSSGRRT